MPRARRGQITEVYRIEAIAWQPPEIDKISAASNSVVPRGCTSAKLTGRHSPIWRAVAFWHEVTVRSSAAHLLDQPVVSVVFFDGSMAQRSSVSWQTGPIELVANP